MTPEELRAAAIEIFGSERGWQSRFAAALGTDRSSVSRYLNGPFVPGPVAAAVTCWLAAFRANGTVPEPQSADD